MSDLMDKLNPMNSAEDLENNLNTLTEEVKKEAEIEREEVALDQEVIEDLDDAIKRVERESHVIDILIKYSDNKTQAIVQLSKSDDRSLQQLEEDISQIYQDLQEVTADLTKKSNEMEDQVKVERDLDNKVQKLGEQINHLKTATKRLEQINQESEGFDY
jgi:SMC interacting uncharacterized protein involved in chromosome segregation